MRVNNPVARAYLRVCPRMEPACGSVTPLGDSTRVNKKIQNHIVVYVHVNTRAVIEGGEQIWQQAAFVRTRTSKQDVQVHIYNSTSIPMATFDMPTSIEQNSLIVLQEQSRYPSQSFLEARVSAAQVFMYS